jgi:hypothetical protein
MLDRSAGSHTIISNSNKGSLLLPIVSRFQSNNIIVILGGTNTESKLNVSDMLSKFYTTAKFVVMTYKQYFMHNF